MKHGFNTDSKRNFPICVSCVKICGQRIDLARRIPAAKTVVCNIDAAILVYTGQVTDVTLWEPLFVEALVAALGVKLAPNLGELNQGQAETEKQEKQEEPVATFTADINQG